MIEKRILKELWPNILWQPTLAMLFTGTVLYVLSLFDTAVVVWAVGGGAMASSAYIVFGMPSSRTARTRNILGGFALAIVCGVFVQYFLGGITHWCEQAWQCDATQLPAVLAAVVVGLVLVLMTVFNCQHPPAAGLALVLVIDLKDFLMLYVIVVAAVVLVVLRIGLKSHLKDLVF